MRQYEIWWASLPPPVGRRPVFLLSRDSAYTVLNRVIVAEVTSTVRDIPVEVRLGRQSFVPQQRVRTDAEAMAVAFKFRPRHPPRPRWRPITSTSWGRSMASASTGC